VQQEQQQQQPTARRRQDRGLHLETESFTWRQRTMTDPGCAIKSKRRCHSRTTVHNGMLPAQYHLPRRSSLHHQFGSLFHLPIPRSSRVHYNFHLPNRKQKKGGKKKEEKNKIKIEATKKTKRSSSRASRAPSLQSLGRSLARCRGRKPVQRKPRTCKKADSRAGTHPFSTPPLARTRKREERL
jgi:hypothetical protein